MLSRVRIILGSALLLTLLTSSTAFAKGNFSFISVGGGDLKMEMRLADPALTDDWFAFADFTRGQTDAPADPGMGYEITRYYMDHNREQAFDHLHYYPDNGYVYYDGIVNGWSEYDGKWYTAQPGIRAAFESALAKAARSLELGASAEHSGGSAPPAETNATPSVVPFAVTAGLAVLFVLAFRLRKASAD